MFQKVSNPGEILFRRSTPGFAWIEFRDCFAISCFRGEGNLAMALIHYGFEGALVTRVPYNVLKQAAINQIRQNGADTNS